MIPTILLAIIFALLGFFPISIALVAIAILIPIFKAPAKIAQSIRAIRLRPRATFVGISVVALCIFAAYIIA